MLRPPKKVSFFALIVLLILGSSYYFSRKNQPTHKYEFTICAIFKNEAPWLKEWIVFHHDVLGFKHFYLYNNDSSDDYQAVLKPFIEKGIVELIEWNTSDPSHQRPNAGDDHQRCQLGAYNHCIERIVGEAKWVAMIDIDEFIVPVNGVRSFHNFMRKIKERRGSVELSWRMFGTSDIQNLEEGELLTENLTWRAADDHQMNEFTKCIHRPEAVPYVSIHHAPDLNPGYRKKHPKPDKFRIHHYWSRTAQFCLNKRKMEKPNTFLESLEYSEDRTMAQYIPRLKRAMSLYP